jgi:hypothetical protein
MKHTPVQGSNREKAESMFQPSTPHKRARSLRSNNLAGPLPPDPDEDVE